MVEDYVAELAGLIATWVENPLARREKFVMEEEEQEEGKSNC